MSRVLNYSIKLLTFSVILYSIHGCNDSRKSGQGKDSLTTQRVVDSLIFGRSFPDSIDYDAYFIDDKLLFLECLVNRFDFNMKKTMYEPITSDPSTSYVPIIECYAGIKAICLFERIISSPKIILKDSSDFICRYCAAGAYHMDKSEIKLSDLKKVKRNYERFMKSNRELSFKQLQMKWSENRIGKVTRKWVKLW